MTTGLAGSTLFRQFGGIEWVIFLIVVALLLLFGPSKLPEFARSVGRAWGEFRRGKMEVEREIRQELAAEDGREALAGREQILRAARELAVPTEGRELADIKLDIARGIDRVDGSHVIAIAKAIGLPVEGVGVQSLKEQVIRRLAV